MIKYSQSEKSIHKAIWPFNIINTGQPQLSTGEVVMEVNKSFGDSLIWNDFKTVTEDISKSIIDEDYSKFQECIYQNHLLLCEIGVVPKKTQDLIQKLKSDGFSAKISGAGCHIGNSAGALITFGETELPSYVESIYEQL